MYSQFIDNVKIMVKDKLITVRIKQDLYDSFKVWTESRNSNISDTLRAFIIDCLNGTARQNIDNADNGISEDTIKKLEDSLYKNLYSQLYNDLSSQLIDNVNSKIDSNLSSQNIDSIDNKDNNSLSSQLIDSIDSIDSGNDSNELSSDSTINVGLVGVENIESNLVSEIIGAIELPPDNIESLPSAIKLPPKNALSEMPTMPLNEDLGVKVPDKESKPVNEKKGKRTKLDVVREYVENLPTGKTFKDRSDLVKEAGFSQNDKGKYDTSFLSRGEGKSLIETNFTITNDGLTKN